MIPTIQVGSWDANATDTDGTEWWLNDVTGWDDLPAERISFPLRQGADGAFDSPGFLSPRVINWQGTVIASTATKLERAKIKLGEIAASLYSGTMLVVIAKDGTQRGVIGKRADQWKIAALGSLSFQYSATLTCPDPLRYSPTLHSASTSLVDQTGRTGGPFKFPASFPIDFAPDAGAGVMPCPNAGNITTYPVIKITGPGSALMVTDQATGLSLIVTSLGNGDVITLDARPGSHSVLLNGSARRDLLDPSSDWFGIPPGYDQLIFTAAAYTAARASVTWRDAWS